MPYTSNGSNMNMRRRMKRRRKIYDEEGSSGRL
jgi:hypothetical protein